ncbi:hypothetical protein V2J09_004383 [Rumex salicifolius]
MLLNLPLLSSDSRYRALSSRLNKKNSPPHRSCRYRRGSVWWTSEKARTQIEPAQPISILHEQGQWRVSESATASGGDQSQTDDKFQQGSSRESLEMLCRRLLAGGSLPKRFFSGQSGKITDSAIADLNKEMEAVFGEPAPSGFDGSSATHIPCEDTQIIPSEVHENVAGLTHVGRRGEAEMVNVSPKDNTERTAIASCKVILGKKVFDLVAANQLAKGDVLTVAKIAGISGAKQTANLIPLCHNIGLSHVRVDLGLNAKEYSVQIEGEATTTGKTGVEMEAMTAVTIAGLTVYDMCKAASKDIKITDVMLKKKSGGKSGDWFRHE